MVIISWSQPADVGPRRKQPECFPISGKPIATDGRYGSGASHYPGTCSARSTSRAYGGTFDFRLDPNNSFYISFVNAGYSEQVHRQIFNLSGLDGSNTGTLLGPSPSPDGSFTATQVVMSEDLRFNLEHFENWIVQGGGRNILGPFIVDYKGSFAQAWDNNPHDFNPSFSTDAV